MFTMRTFVCLFALAQVIYSETTTPSEHCFTFNGDSFLVFSPPSNRFHRSVVQYELEFKTDSLNGVLMYASGPVDYEGLFIRGGNLHYLLFNSASSGIGRQSGAYHVSEERVDTGSWIKVNVYRSVTERGFRRSHSKTGFEFELNGSLRSYVDHTDRHGINISPTIHVGGYSQPLGAPTLGNFTGQIRGFKEIRGGEVFENPSLNYKSLVDLHCD